MNSFKKVRKIYEGAEAEIWIIEINKKKLILKQRISKRYREPLLDSKIISQRIKHEANMCKRALNANIMAPNIYEINVTDKYLIMNYFDANSFKKTIKKHKDKIKLMASGVAKLHNSNIIHGDMTLENVLFDEKKQEPIFIDFGLSFVSTRIDDFATDLFVFKETLLADFDEQYWNLFIKQYEKEINKKEILKQFEKIEKRRKNG